MTPAGLLQQCCITASWYVCQFRQCPET